MDLSSGIVSRLPTLAHLTDATEFSSSVRLWPTPQASEAKSDTLNVEGRKDRGKQIMLCHAVRMWPTPTLSGNYNWKGTSKQSGDGLATAAKMWPTPRVQMATRKVEKRKYKSGEKRHDNLEEEVAERMWPTPRASEWKGVGPLGSKSHDYRLQKGYLDATAQDREQISGALNPQWVSWLMGLPMDWCDMPDELPKESQTEQKS
jgi:hypothetical protein